MITLIAYSCILTICCDYFESMMRAHLCFFFIVKSLANLLRLQIPSSTHLIEHSQLKYTFTHFIIYDRWMELIDYKDYIIIISFFFDFLSQLCMFLTFIDDVRLCFALFQ